MRPDVSEEHATLVKHLASHSIRQQTLSPWEL